MGEGADVGITRRNLAHARGDLEETLSQAEIDPRALAAISSAIAFIEVAEARLASRPCGIEPLTAQENTNRHDSAARIGDPMADRLQVRCINKSLRNDPHRRIMSIGGVGANSTRWKLGEDEAITGINSGKWAFFVLVNGREVDVHIARRPGGREYLKTVADDYEPNNLLALPECP
jgi:hypothetical protein